VTKTDILYKKMSLLQRNASIVTEATQTLVKVLK